MSSSGSEGAQVPVVTTFHKDLSSSSSSVEPPMEEWSSLILQPTAVEHPKKTLFNEGLYDPGSGEICTKYVAMSASSVLRHPYYAYPGLKDPGIVKAILEPEDPKIYPLDGQTLYLDVCDEMKMVPIKTFLRGLLEEVIDLKYYGVNPTGVRAMSMALNYNPYVRRLDLSSNFLTEDACYHLGQMLRENASLQELILSGCRIKPEGARRLVVNLFSRGLDELDLSRNELEDIGFQYLANQIEKGAAIRRLNLSYNNLSSVSAVAFANAIEGNKSITHLDVSWNRMSTTKDVSQFLKILGDSQVLVELNLSWNSLTLGMILKKIIMIPTLRILILCNNRMGKDAAKAIANNLRLSKNLHTIDLSFNPLAADDAFLIVNKLRLKKIKLANLFMDNVEVDKKFVKECEEVRALSFRKNCTITYGDVKHNYEVSMPDFRLLLMNRLDFLAAHGSKKHHMDIALYFLEKKKTCDNMQAREIMAHMKSSGIPIDDDLVNAVIDAFPGPKSDKGVPSLNLAGIIDMITRLWPDRKLPPTPPPEPEPESAKQKKKGKK